MSSAKQTADPPLSGAPGIQTQLADELRAAARALNECVIDEAAARAALVTAKRLRQQLAGTRRPRWYETDDLERRAGPATRTGFNTHSMYRGTDNVLSVPLTSRLVSLPDGRRAVEGHVTCPPLYEGPPGGVHGGYVAGLFDDVLGSALQLVPGPSALTGTLTVRYRSLTPLQTGLRFTGWIHHVSGRRVVARATCHAGERLTAEAEGLFVRIDMTQLAERAAREALD